MKTEEQKKAARKIASAKWYADHKDQAAENRRAWRAANPERTKALQAAWNLAHPGRGAELSAILRRNHPDYAGHARHLRLKKLEDTAERKKPKRCEVCRKFGIICFDHDHHTGKFRGWICSNCNSALGYADDSPKILRKLAEYVKRPLQSSVRVTYRRNLDAYIKLLGSQPPVHCEVCLLKKRICVDHHHKTGLFRGWLCNGCNVSLGYVKDSAKLLCELAEYLERFELSTRFASKIAA